MRSLRKSGQSLGPPTLPNFPNVRFVVDVHRDSWGARRKYSGRKGREETRRDIGMNEQILQESSDFCRQQGLAESTFGRRAVNDGKLASRLRNGGRITTDTLDRIRAFMAQGRDDPPARRRILFDAGAAVAAGTAPPASFPTAQLTMDKPPAPNDAYGE